MAELARTMDELIARNAVCATCGDPLYSLRRGGRCGQTGQRRTFEFKLTRPLPGPYLDRPSYSVTRNSRSSRSRPSFEGLFNHHYDRPAHILTPDRQRSKLFTTSCQNVSKHPSYSYRTSLMRQLTPTLTVLIDSMVAQGAVAHFMLLLSRARRLKGFRW